MTFTNIRALLTYRQQGLGALRQFLNKHEYLEAEVPVLVPSLIPESYLETFETELTSPRKAPSKAFLTASPEAYLKRLLVEGVGNVFYLGKAFRNGEPLGSLHNHEFTILEWYKINYSYLELMKEIEQMIGFVAKELHTNIGINFEGPWEYLTISEAYSRFVPETEITNYKSQITNENFEKCYVQYIEPNLGTRGKPTFIIDFPAWQSPLAKPKELGKKTQTVERFELYINGIELINGWTELTDWKVQETNLLKENEERLSQGKKPLPMDKGFITALKKGMPECAGAAMGVDRLLMVLGGFKTLKAVLPFPTSEIF